MQLFTRFGLIFFSLYFLCAQGAQAQATTAGITGAVSSDKNEALAGATVAAIHLPTGIRRSITSDGVGSFTITDLLVGGPYTLQVVQAGYRTLLVNNVFLVADKQALFNFTLNPELVAVGTRRSDRTVLESAVPVDVIDMRALSVTAPQTDMTQILNYVVPSFNSTRQTSAGGSDHVDPASLRGLGTDQMLVLVNGKRRHTTALINLVGNRGVGNVGTDLNTIASNSVDRIEILRDGAAAQYGSDAIAGVMNISLKSDNKGGNVLVGSGVTTQGDGLTTLASVNKGFKLGPKGFLNLTLDADHRGSTTRDYSRDLFSRPVFSSDRATENAALAANGKTYQDFAQRNGDARIDNYRGIFNASLAATDKVKLYAFGGYNYRRGNAAAPWVLPVTQADNIIESIFPLGYQPLINTRSHDASGAVGAVVSLGPWSLDVSHVLGYNQMRYNVSNTLNASLGANSPTEFEAGGFQFTQNVTNATVSRLFPTFLAGTNVAFGAEYRNDNYQIVEGEQRSWGRYDDGKANSGPGSQGFLGFAPESDVVGARSNVGGFVDVEADITKKWSVTTALRFENYSDFGSAFIYKVTSRYQVIKPVAVRGAFNTGFRAPSLQQVLYRQLSLESSATGVRYSGIFNNQDEVTRAAGIPALGPEKSLSYSAGLVVTPLPNLSFTADVYRIDIKDRIILSGLFGTGISANLDAALFRYSTDRAQFFTNAVDTRTTGLDLVANYQHELGRGSFTVTAAANFNRTSIQGLNVPANFQSLQNDDDANTNYIDPRQLSLIETGSPASKVLLNLGYELGKFNVLVRNTYFGRVEYFDTNTDATNDFGSYFLSFAPRTVTDLIVGYKPLKSLGLTAGVNNLFNVFPNTTAEAARNGRPPGGFATEAQFNAYYQERFGKPSNLPEGRDIFPYNPVQMGFNGAFVYLKAVYTLGL
ncbi:TonB-dependent receptor [Hymenobacter elongatus]|uniref:TonB-dependent receptor n=1 Tax=Hymenobacter elongatus TaxID=877208 RepID=A0A4Z0PM19_9BACT|nr:TonB-dependent receptor [Hymenobacter elongatus]TGE17180.1 TonB-dependent receptor [Hymenobacter elongatus]